MKAQSACWLVCDLYVTAAFYDWPDWPVHHCSPLTVCHCWGCSCSAVISGPGIKRICGGTLRSVAVGILVEKSSPAEEKYMTPLRRLQPSTGATAAHEISVQGLDNTLLLKEDPRTALGVCFFFPPRGSAVCSILIGSYQHAKHLPGQSQGFHWRYRFSLHSQIDSCWLLPFIDMWQTLMSG